MLTTFRYSAYKSNRNANCKKIKQWLCSWSRVFICAWTVLVCVCHYQSFTIFECVIWINSVNERDLATFFLSNTWIVFVYYWIVLWNGVQSACVCVWFSNNFRTTRKNDLAGVNRMSRCTNGGEGACVCAADGWPFSSDFHNKLLERFCIVSNQHIVSIFWF